MAGRDNVDECIAHCASAADTCDAALCRVTLTLAIFDNARIVCGTGFMKRSSASIRPYVCLSVCLFDPSTAVAACGRFAGAPCGQEISIDSLRRRSATTAPQHGAQQQTRTVPC